MIEVIHKKRRWWLPECWDECSPRQFTSAIAVLTGGDNPVKSQLGLLRALLDMPWWKFRLIGAEALMQMLPLTEWVGEDTSITRQLVPIINAGEKLFGPKEGFTNITAGEFHFADMFYNAWKQDEDPLDLYRFVAVLYRPSKPGYDASRDPDGDIRVAFNDNLVEFYARRLARHSSGDIPSALAVAVVFCYESWRMRLEQEHKRIFNRKAKATAARYGWLPVLRGIAKGGQYGTMDNVETMYFGTLMVELELLTDEEAELKRKHPELFKS